MKINQSLRSRPLLVIGLAVLFLITTLFLTLRYIWPIVGIDWKDTYYPAAQAVLHGKSPYIVPTFRNPPWAILPLLPFALLSEELGGGAFFVTSILLYGWAAYRLKASPIAICAFLLSPPVIYGLRMMNVDVFVLLGFSFVAPIGLFFVIIKPQMGIVMCLFWLVEAWQMGGIKNVFRTFIPIGIASLLSFLLFGNWIAGRQSDLLHVDWNASLWPWAIPIGIVLTLLSVRDKRKDYAMSASPFLSPYLAYHSWASVLAGLLRNDFILVTTVISMWLVALIRGLGY